MKRGFLNSGKAKAKLAKATDLTSPAPKAKPEILPKIYGRPEGYEVEKRIYKELDALTPTELLDDGLLLCTTQPSVNMDTTPADFPDGWTECIVNADVKRLILNTPGFPARLVRPASRKYRLAPTPGKDHGLFSTGTIRTGELILSERPLTLTPVTFSSQMRFTKDLTPEQKFQATLYEWEQTAKMLFDRLHPENQAAFMSLANSHQHDGSGPIVGVIRTNGLGVACLQTGRYTAEEQETQKRGVYNAVCKEISRLNHSCSPNTEAHFDIPTFSYQLFAARNIIKGEELTLAYTGLTTLTEIRQKELEPYGFRCTCAACLAPSTSDPQRAIIACMPITNIDDGLVRLALIEEQGLQVCDEYCQTLKTIMELSIGIGDAETARTYAKKLANRPWSPHAVMANITLRGLEVYIKARGRTDTDSLAQSLSGLDLTKAK
ncbi:hypothetical protein DFH06DRAFT_1321959 [Mycena polygramma]|nr:hypothetical protein DFH06DRAFT_1321959 [Mycena polygramma]